jgi:hypothetical protein
MSTKDTQSLDFNNLQQGKNKQKKDVKLLYKVLFNSPVSRRMAATNIGYTDQTYMVTQYINDWIKQGKAAVIGRIKCSRSGRFVEGVTTNPDLFPKSNQLNLF